MKIRKAQEGLADALLKPINSAAIVVLGVYTLLWGLWIANPFWTVFNTAKLYHVLMTLPPAYVSPEYFWGSIAIICGLITIRGAYKRSYRALVLGSSIAGWHWFMIGLLYLAGDWHNTGGITALTFAIYSAFIYLNIRVNSDKMPRLKKFRHRKKRLKITKSRD